MFDLKQIVDDIEIESQKTTKKSQIEYRKNLMKMIKCCQQLRKVSLPEKPAKSEPEPAEPEPEPAVVEKPKPKKKSKKV